MFIYCVQARRSMRFAKHLRDAGDKFRQKYLKSNDKDDKTEMDEDWTTMKVGIILLHVCSALCGKNILANIFSWKRSMCL